MITQYQCTNRERASAVRRRHPPTLNGIDFVEVVAVDQKTLAIHFLHPLPGEPGGVPANPPLTVANVAITGGVRITNILVLTASSNASVLTVTVREAGDFSTYTIRLVTSPTNFDPPAGFDPQLSAAGFSFKATCPSEFDCREESTCAPTALAEPEINYLAKDYASFRRLMLDRLSVLLPDWQERSPADLQIALVELLAYVGDHLSYYQDAVATEAYLGTARNRTSVRRHARLLDYAMHDGCNARAWVCIGVKPQSTADGQTLPRQTMLFTRGAGSSPAVPTAEVQRMLADQPVVFETMHAAPLRAAHNRISFYTWSDSQCCLPQGSTQATLRDGQPPLALAIGDVLIVEELKSPTTGLAADADPTHRQAVRLTAVTPGMDKLDNTPIVAIEWHEQDALRFSLCISARVRDASGQEVVQEISVARGNAVLADHGCGFTGQQLVPPQVPRSGPYRPRLPRAEVSYASPYDHAVAIGQGSGASPEPAATAARQDPRTALAQVQLRLGNELWSPQRDLLGSDRFSAEFVVEMEQDGTAYVRFGDDVQGKQPPAGGQFQAAFRLGNGRHGNVGAGAIARVVTDMAGITEVSNPLPATGGTDPESLEQVRQFAPQAFRTQQRAVTEADYVTMAERHPEVQKASATFRWTGSWYTVFVTIDRKGGLPVSADPEFVQSMRQHLDQFRVAGYDLEINEPVFVPLDLALLVCVQPGYFRSDVKARLLDAFSRRGFFHPDRFTFGQPVYLSRIYQAALAVTGVASVEVQRLQRYRHKPDQELDNGLVAPAPLEIIRLDNDPNFPENGRLELELHGGL